MSARTWTALIACLACAPGLRAAERVDLEAVQRIRDEGFRRSQVMDTLAYLTDVIGPRLTGSPQMRAANEWTRDKLKEWGLADARLESYGPFGPGWSLEHVAVRMVAPSVAPIVAWPKAWTPGTDGVVRGQALLARLAAEADFAAWKGKLAGRVVMLSAPPEIKAGEKPTFSRYDDDELRGLGEYAIPTGDPGPRERARERRRFAAALHRFLAEEKPLAAVQASDAPGGSLRVMGAGLRAKDDPRGVPFVVMAAEPYARIARLLGRGLEVELELDLRVRFHEDDLMAYNTLADLPGSGPKRQEVVMIGAHLDSWHGATGATDNGAGSAVAMEAMRILSSLGTRPRRAVRIGLWSGEEQGLLGSRAYVAQHLASGARGYGDEADPGPLRPLPDHALFSAYFNLDGGTGRLRGVHLQENLAAQPILEAWAGPLADLGLRTVTQRRDFSTDHVAFDDAGLPAFNFIQDRIEYDTLTHHTTLDVYDRAQREDLMQAAVVLASFAWQAANREELMPRKPLSQAGRRDRR